MAQSSSGIPPINKKVLIVTYYWPPSGGSGVQRWLKFIKYLPHYGWEPFVFTPENPSFEIRDDTLMKDVPAEADVIRFPIWEPYSLLKMVWRLTGKKNVRQTDLVSIGKKNISQSVIGWIRGNLLIPDARIFWVKPSVVFLKDFLKSNEINTIITTGPPHSLHLIGLKLKRDNPSLRWIADFRDPWSEWDFLDTLSLTSWARKKHQRLEREVLKNADEVLSIAPYHVKRLENSGERKVHLVTNGFDEDDFKTIKRIRTSVFTIRHIGMVDELRDPKPFMLAIKTLAQNDPSFLRQAKIQFIGSINSTFLKFIGEDPVLSAITTFTDPLPHAAILDLYGETDIQLLILAHTQLAAGNLPGKFFEYLASGNFILGVGPEKGDAAHILNATNAGIMIDRENVSAITALLKERFDAWRVGSDPHQGDVSSFSRKFLTKQLSDLLLRR